MLRRVRLLQFRITLSPRFLYLWARAIGAAPAFTPPLPPGEGGLDEQTRTRPALREVGT
jgi:hypothetical protein